MVTWNKELQEKYNRLLEEYNKVQDAMFHYNEYARDNKENSLTPRQLHSRRSELFEELAPVIIALRETEKPDRQTIDYWIQKKEEG